MPIYNMQCTKCYSIFEVITSYEKASKMACECGYFAKILPSKPAIFIIEGACAANGYESQDNIPDDHYDPRVGQTSWDE